MAETKRLDSTLLNMFVVLTAVALISAGALGFTYSKTKPVLDELKRQQQVEAVSAVIDGFDNQPIEEVYTVEDYPNVELYPAMSNGQRIGTAVRTYTEEGYGGSIQMMVGFDADGVITGLTVLEHAETPGLGAKITESDFKEQFEGFDPSSSELAVAKDGGDVDAVTAATISSRAVCDALQRAYDAVKAGGEL